jgi:cytochrome c556
MEDAVARKVAVHMIAVLTLAFAGSCTPDRHMPRGGARRGSRSADASAPTARRQGPARLGEHWVQDERLRAVMAQISKHAERWPVGLPDHPEAAQSNGSRADTDDAFRDAAALAEGLADAARQIPRSVADHPMSAEDRRGFAAEADRLRRHALDLRRAARGRSVEQMQRSLDRVSSTCVSCHSQYRDFAGELGARKASAQ